MPAGRPKKPTNLKRLEGNPGKRSLNTGEPEPAEGPVSCPHWLDGTARAEWKRIVPELRRMGLLTMADRAALAAYCQTYSRWRWAEAAIQEYGMTIVKGNGYPAQRPEVAIANNALATMRGYLSEFGLSPSSRAKLGTQERQQQPDDLDALRERNASRRTG